MYVLVSGASFPEKFKPKFRIARGKVEQGQEVWSRALIGQDGVVTLKVASI